MTKINISFLLGLLLILTSFNSLNPSQYKLSTIVIDAGHGGKDPGARGKISWEKDIALSISLELGRILKENIPALNIIYTRKEDKFLTLYRRSEIANKANADLFISIHADSFSKSSVYGATTYLMGLSKTSANMNVAKRENSVIFDNFMISNLHNQPSDRRLGPYSSKLEMRGFLYAQIQIIQIVNCLFSFNYVRNCLWRKRR